MHRLVLVATSAFVFVSAAIADERPEAAQKNWSVIVGAGGLYAPDYEGSDDYELRVLPNVRIEYAGWLSASVPEGLKISLLNEDGFKAGVLAGYRFGRDDDDNLALAGWGDIDGALDLGAFAEYKFDAIRVALDVRHGVSDDNLGTVATLSARYALRVAGAMVSVGPQVRWADDDYTQTYFGISASQAAVSVLGYSPYSADGGIKDYGLGATVMVPLGGAWSVTGLVSVSRLTGDAADSPIVADQGSETQISAGAFVGYRF
ncbi:MAG: MipA/OmpV family protein [Alphaproteobacteria bacterium]|nr:MipA/OmpV family protein [Alphaproteobacteria bacterium]